VRHARKCERTNNLWCWKSPLVQYNIHWRSEDVGRTCPRPSDLRYIFYCTNGAFSITNCWFFHILELEPWQRVAKDMFYSKRFSHACAPVWLAKQQPRIQQDNMSNLKAHLNACEFLQEHMQQMCVSINITPLHLHKNLHEHV